MYFFLNKQDSGHFEIHQHIAKLDRSQNIINLVGLSNFLLLLFVVCDFSYVDLSFFPHCLLLHNFTSIHYPVVLWLKLCCIYALFSWYFTLSITFLYSGINLFFLHFLLYCIFPYYFYTVYTKKIKKKKHSSSNKSWPKSIHKESILIIWRKDDCLLSPVYNTLEMCAYFLFFVTFYILLFTLSLFFLLLPCPIRQTVDDVIRIVVAKKMSSLLLGLFGPSAGM